MGPLASGSLGFANEAYLLSASWSTPWRTGSMQSLGNLTDLSLSGLGTARLCISQPRAALVQPRR
jgi:hypothetical protein